MAFVMWVTWWARHSPNGRHSCAEFGDRLPAWLVRYANMPMTFEDTGQRDICIWRIAFFLLAAVGTKVGQNFVSAFRGFNSTGFSGLLTFFIPLDSPWNALQLCFWVRDNQTKFSSANSRQSFSARRRHRLLTPRNSRISGRTFHLIDSDSKDFW